MAKTNLDDYRTAYTVSIDASTRFGVTTGISASDRAHTLRVLADRPGAETGFVFVDPDGFVGDPAYDLGVALRDWCPQILSAEDPVALTRGYCRLLARDSGLDEQAIWEWGYLERVSTGLYATAMGAHELGRPFLETAEMLL